MGDKPLIFGVSYDVDNLIKALLKENIELNLEKDYYVNISSPPIPDSIDFADSVISGLFVDIKEDVVIAILNWLREQEKEHREKPKLKICIEGNLLNIDIEDMQILLKILKDCSKKENKKC